MMDEQAIPDADYIVKDAGSNFEPRAEGEVYMICQGSAGSYGDVLERAPEMLIKDVAEGLLSPELAEEIYGVVFDEITLALNMTATETARSQLRKDRVARDVPFDEFCETWVKPGPDESLPYFGSWGDENDDIVAAPPGDGRVCLKGPILNGVLLSNPKDRRIAELEAELQDLRGPANS